MAVFTVPTRGIGKPDYSKEVSSGISRVGIRLKYNQTAVILAKSFSVIASPYAWVVGQLLPAASAHLVDISTGVETPYTVPVGYTLTMLEMATSFSEDVESGFYMDFQPFIPLSLTSVGIHSGGMPIIQDRLLPISTGLIDPSGAIAHQLDGIYTNVGLGNMTGGIDILCILEAVGTKPLPVTKIIACKFCGHKQGVPRNLIHMKCPKCGEITMYANADAFRAS